MVYIHPLQRLLRRSWRDQWLLVQAYMALGIARTLVLTVPFRHIAPHLGAVRTETPAMVTPTALAAAQRMSWAVRSASRYTPWDSNCLAQAITAKWLLRRCGIGSTLYLGAAFDDRRSLEAHAWLRCGPIFVTGGDGSRKYGSLAAFGGTETR